MKIEQGEGRGYRGACQMVFPNISMHPSPHPLQEEEQLRFILFLCSVRLSWKSGYRG